MPMDRIKITFLMLFILFPDLCRAQDTKKQVTAYLPSIVSDVIVKDLHTKERFRRLRKHDEQWSDYFCKVLLWPYDEYRYNGLFATLDQGGRKVQFISSMIFDVDNQWVLVLRGDWRTVSLMGENIILESPRDKIRLSPVKTVIVKNLTDETRLGFVIFPKPEQPVTEIMSSFALFGNAGGVASIVPEEQIPYTTGFELGVDLVDAILKKIGEENIESLIP
jgi:hypothetical protein